MAGKGLVLAYEMIDSSPLLADIVALKARFDDDGYLLMRNFLPRRNAMRARQEVVRILERDGLLKEHSQPMDSICKDKTVNAGLLSRPEIAQIDSVQNYLEHKNFFDFFDRFFGEASCVIRYKWLRAVCYNQFTGAPSSL